VPQQQNGYDCGVFSIMCADYVSDNLPLSYVQEDMQNNRVKIAAAIRRGHLTY
jgi:sentrin-specific protease 1